jgi:hypothetical protein
MSELLLYGGGLLLVLFLLDRVPGVRLLAKPMIEGVAKLAAVFIGSFWLWALFFVKSNVRSHVVFLRHLFTRREKLAPEERIRHDGTMG